MSSTARRPFFQWELLGHSFIISLGVQPLPASSLHSFCHFAHRLFRNGDSLAGGERSVGPLHCFKNLRASPLTLGPQIETFLDGIFLAGNAAFSDGVANKRGVLGVESNFHTLQRSQSSKLKSIQKKLSMP